MRKLGRLGLSVGIVAWFTLWTTVARLVLTEESMRGEPPPTPVLWVLWAFAGFLSGALAAMVLALAHAGLYAWWEWVTHNTEDDQRKAEAAARYREAQEEEKRRVEEETIRKFKASPEYQAAMREVEEAEKGL